MASAEAWILNLLGAAFYGIGAYIYQLIDNKGAWNSQGDVDKNFVYFVSNPYFWTIKLITWKKGANQFL